MLDTLRERDVVATFFIVGTEGAQTPGVLEAMVADGHELGNHSWTHKRMTWVGVRGAAEEIEPTDEVIRAAGQEGPIHFRPPYGKKLFGVPLFLSRQDRKTIMWDIEPESYPEIASDPELIVEHVMERIEPGSIIILHPMYPMSGARTRTALPDLIDRILAEGYSFVTVSELLDIGEQ